MKDTLNRLAMVVALALSSGGLAMADTPFVSFDNFNLNSIYGSWADSNVATLTSGPTSFNVESIDFGGGFHNVIPDVDATGETTIEMDVTVNAGIAGIVLAVGDSDFTEWNYAWYGLPPGNHVLTVPVNTPLFVSNNGGNSMLDLNALDYIHIQVDEGIGANFYDVSYNNLRLTGVIPEPASALLLIAGAIGLMVARRRCR